jgi:hypothetical protein
MTPQDITAKQELLRIFSSAWSYKANLLYQKMRVAEMDNNTAEKENFKNQGDQARSTFTGLNEVEKKMQTEIDDRKKTAEAEKDKEKSANAQ